MYMYNTISVYFLIFLYTHIFFFKLDESEDDDTEVPHARRRRFAEGGQTEDTPMEEVSIL